MACCVVPNLEANVKQPIAGVHHPWLHGPRNGDREPGRVSSSTLVRFDVKRASTGCSSPRVIT